ncbi:tyrosine-protein kinase family protein [Streptomyces sp. NPDC088812]|uniref:tyrosine-protein kinase family protein n=1 Tax=Streptomyces sp. NPDC088812 TaxID=3365905 RepID=UPI00380A6A9D
MSDRETADEITAAVRELVPSAVVHVVRDAGGVLVRAESDAFAPWSHEERRSKLMSRLRGEVAEQVHTWELLTASEAEWYGDLAHVEEGARLPLWATALERAQDVGDVPWSVTFASDLDEDLDSAPVVTFYSLKGGVGRSTALVAVARRLTAEHGLTVVCIDMDLEAPGLDALFGIENQVDPDQGVVSALLQCEFGQQESVLEHVIPVDDSGRLYCMPAGRIDSAYAAQLRALEPEIWYRERTNALHRLIDDVRDSNLRPDVVLIDSRTGVSPVAAPLLFDISDMAIVCFHPHAQARAGTEMLTKALLGATTRRSVDGRPLTPEPRFVVSPMPPGSSATRLAERAKSWVEAWTAAAGSQREGDSHGLSAEEITHTVPYNAEIAFTDTVVGAKGQLAPYARIADWIVQIVPEPNTMSSLHGRTSVGKTEALRQLSFSTGTAEILDHEEFLQDYVVTRQVNETAAPGVPLILGRKGTGKTALFRWLAAGKLTEWEPVLVTTPNQYQGRPAWSFGPDNYAAVGRALDQRGLDWGSFWQVLMALAIYESYGPAREQGAPHPALADLGSGDFAVTQAVFDVLDDPMGPLRCGDWLQRVDAGAERHLLLLFDGLDTAFGHSPAQRSRRSAAIAGLLTKEADLTSRLHGIRLKVFVRQDIWQGLRFENKSHFFGLSRRLQWEDREEYFKVVLKRAVRAPAFAEVLAEIDPVLPGTEVAAWGPEQVAAAWGALVGERMRGERTAFTANWVWNRLADGNGDHSPRALLQLFAAALEWERSEEKRSGYDRSVLRPRSLALSLESVSDKALSALLDEEFQELRQAAEALREYGRTPVGEDALSGIEEDLVGLAQEAGLLETLDSDGPERLFRVPDLYRWALGVTRRGPM